MTNPYLEALSKIPKGETRSFGEIAVFDGGKYLLQSRGHEIFINRFGCNAINTGAQSLIWYEPVRLTTHIDADGLCPAHSACN